MLWWCFWLTIFLAMAGCWYPCGCAGDPMSICSPWCIAGTTPPTVSVVITGSANDNCDDCASINGTWIALQQVKIQQLCHWVVPRNFDLACTGTGPDWFDIDVKMFTFLGTYRWYVILDVEHFDNPVIYTNGTDYTWNSGGTTAIDCSVNRTLTEYMSSGSGSGDACDFTGVTIQVQPN